MMKIQMQIYQSCLSALLLLQAKVDGPSFCANEFGVLYATLVDTELPWHFWTLRNPPWNCATCISIVPRLSWTWRTSSNHKKVLNKMVSMCWTWRTYTNHKKAPPYGRGLISETTHYLSTDFNFNIALHFVDWGFLGIRFQKCQLWMNNTESNNIKHNCNEQSYCSGQ